MTTRTYQTHKRSVRRSRRIARQTGMLASPVAERGVIVNRIGLAA